MTESIQTRKDFLAAVKKGLENNPKRLPPAMVVYQAFISDEKFKDDDGVQAIEKTMWHITRNEPKRLGKYISDLEATLKAEAGKAFRKATSVRLKVFPKKLEEKMVYKDYSTRFPEKRSRTG